MALLAACMRWAVASALCIAAISGCAGADRTTIIDHVTVTDHVTSTVTVTVQATSTSCCPPGGGAPEMGFTKDNTGRTITVVRAPVGDDAIQYIDGLAFGGSCGSGAVDSLNGSGSAPANTDTVTAGDVLHVTPA